MPIPAGFTQHSSGWWFKTSDQSGPYTFDGTTVTLVPVGAVQGSATSGQTGTLVSGAVTTAAPAYTTAQTSPLSLTTNGGLRVAVGNSGSDVLVSNTQFDSFASSQITLYTTGLGFNYNGTSWDRTRGNVDTAALLTYAAAAAGSNGTDQTNYNARGVKLVIDITALTGTSPTLTVTIQGKDAASGKYYTILASTALAAVATTTLEIYPGIIAAANVTAGVTLPRVWRVIATIAGTTPAVTATVGASVIV